MSSPRILVTGAFGQIGSELVPLLRARYGANNVVAAGHKKTPSEEVRAAGPYAVLDVTQKQTIEAVVDEYQVNAIFHLAAILSGDGERNPALAWNVNMQGLYNVLEIARDRKIEKVFCPSSIAAFGPETPREQTPQETVLLPKTMYGVTKVAGELLCDYYVHKFGVDVRGVRYPGIISSEVLPSGGTTDYAVEIFYEALLHGKYTCFLQEDSRLPMMYMPDCLKATIDLFEADFASLTHHSNFNLAAMSFTPAEIAREIQKHIPSFTIDYQPDFRQAIADSWPASIDDSAARKEWNWKPTYDLAAMTKDMLEKLGDRHKAGLLHR